MPYSYAERGVLADVGATASTAATRDGRPLGARAHEILVVDQGEPLSSPLAAALAECGFRTTVATSGCGALAALQRPTVDVVLLDLVLPDMNGKDLIERMRAICQTPIMVLADKGFEDDAVEALDLGANDFMAKPFSVPELMARLRVAVRPKVARNLHERAPVIGFDFKARRFTVANRERRLTVRETEMLRVLHAAGGAVVSHKTLVADIWGADGHGDLTRLRVLAWQVRRKIEPDPSNPQFLLAAPGLGYRLARAWRS